MLASRSGTVPNKLSATIVGQMARDASNSVPSLRQAMRQFPLNKSRFLEEQEEQEVSKKSWEIMV